VAQASDRAAQVAATDSRSSSWRGPAGQELLLRSRYRIEFAERLALDQWLWKHRALRALYEGKEAMHSLYRTHGRERAKVALAALTDRLIASNLSELQTLRRTLIRWRHVELPPSNRTT
jgi:Transposase